MSLVTFGWIVWPTLLALCIAGIFHIEVVEKRRARRLQELVEIVSCRSEWWAPVDWIEL